MKLFKNILIISCLTFAVVLDSFSQEIHWGVKGGGNISYHKISGSDEDTRSSVGWSLGLFAEIKPNKYFLISPEVNYVKKGAEIGTVGSNNTVSYTSIGLDYISIPINAKIGLNLNQLFIFMLAGPRFDVHIGENENGLSGIYKSRNNFNWGLCTGLGISFIRNGGRSIGLEVRYNPDFTSYKVDNYIKNGITYSFSNGTTFRNESIELIGSIGFK